MYKSVVYEGDKLLGEVEVYPQNQNQNQDQNGVVFDKEIRISHFSQPSERCPPLAVLHTITSNGVCFKMESKSHSQDSPLYLLHSSCSEENKTAVMLLGGEELHLVAMASRKNDGRCLCFWGFNIALGLYNSCLVMLNLRCLGIVFDLDETLIVANTMRSFEDRIEALQRKISTEADQQRISGMLAEVKRYQDDKIILKQYAENDQVVENGKVVNSQSEVVPALSDNYQPIVRPLIRLQDKNIILTRINPQIRDTSVLVRLRPAWEDLRSYLTARGRKRFEVYVCTMAERDYALEMWRLLDPDSNLINSKELLNRIVSVKSGSRKSLFNVFQDGICHPKMALVIDDRVKVWDEKDQPRVHVVPAFAPYYAPQAEANNVVPVLCVARNVACNVRGGFFREFDDGLLQRIPEVMYEDDIKDIPSVPDVSNYLMSEDDPSTLNANKDPLAFDGMADAEVERRLKDAISASSTVPSAVTNLDPRLAPLQYTVASSSISIPPSTFQGPSMPFPGKQLPQLTSVVKPLSQVAPPEAGLQSSPAREEGEVPESELDPDTRRRLLILQHGQDTRDHGLNEPQFPVRPPAQVSVPRMQPRGSWFPVDEEMSPRLLNQVAAPKEFPLNSEAMHIEKHRIHHPPFLHKMESSIPSDRVLENQRLPKEAFQREDQLRMNHSLSSYHSFSDSAHLHSLYSYPNLGTLRAALRIQERSWAKLLNFELTYRYTGRRKARVTDFLLEDVPEPDPNLPQINLVPLTAEQEMAKRSRVKAFLTATTPADVQPTSQATETVVALPSQQPSSSRRNKRARTSQTRPRLEDETTPPPSPPPSLQQIPQPEQSDRTASSSKWAPVLTFNDRDITASDSVISEKDHLMAFNLAKSVCLPKDMAHHYKQLNTELKSIRSSTKSIILAIQKNEVTHRRVMELRRNTREAMAEAEAKSAELEEAKKQLAELRAVNGRLTEVVNSAEAEKQKIATETKDKYLCHLAKIEKKKDTEINELKAGAKKAEERGFKKAEEAYTLQCDAAKDLFFKCGWRTAVEQLGCTPDTEVYNAPPYSIPASLSQYAADLQRQFLEGSDEDDDDDVDSEDDEPTPTPVINEQPNDQSVRLEPVIQDLTAELQPTETELPAQTVLPTDTGLQTDADAVFDAELDALLR